MREILLVSSEERRVQLWRREAGRWTVEDVVGEPILRLESCDLELSLAEVYAGM